MAKSNKVKSKVEAKINDNTRRPFAVIIKCSEDCNYKCDYCYVEKHCNCKIMDLKTAEITIKKVLHFVRPGRKVNFIWHGGEPLLAGKEFFKKISYVSKRFEESKIEHCIQTNGSLITEDWLEFLDHAGFLVSISIDGPEKYHDMHRKKPDGSGTFKDVMKATELIRAKTGFPACVAVLHKSTINHIEDIYKFFKHKRINFRINPVVKSGRANSNYNDLSITASQYGNAMCKLFDLWFSDNGEIKVEPLSTILGNFIFPSVQGCDFHGNCLESIISINPDGTVYPCGRFSGLEEFQLGDILKDNLHVMFSSDKYYQLPKRSPDTVPGCSTCEFVDICNAGCMITAHMARGNILDRDYYCQGRKMLFSHISDKLNKHLCNIEV